jgi:hypothetical protein
MEVGNPPPPSPFGDGAPAPVRDPSPIARSEQSFALVLNALSRRIDQGPGLISRAERGGAALDSRQLIALQSGIYRYTEAVELAAKLVDRAGSAIKTTLQSQ